MDKYTFYLLEFLEEVHPASQANMNDLVSVCVCMCEWLFIILAKWYGECIVPQEHFPYTLVRIELKKCPS